MQLELWMVKPWNRHLTANQSPLFCNVSAILCVRCFLTQLSIITGVHVIKLHNRWPSRREVRTWARTVSGSLERHQVSWGEEAPAPLTSVTGEPVTLVTHTHTHSLQCVWGMDSCVHQWMHDFSQGFQIPNWCLNEGKHESSRWHLLWKDLHCSGGAGSKRNHRCSPKIKNKVFFFFL